MFGGGNFSILGVSVERIINATPLAIPIDGLSLLTAFSYVKLAILHEDSAHSFFTKTFPNAVYDTSALG